MRRKAGGGIIKVGSGVVDVFVKAVEGFHDPGMGYSQVHADGVVYFEWSAVLPVNADFIALPDQGVAIRIMGFDPLIAVQIEHLGALGPLELHAFKVFIDIIVSIIAVIPEHFAEVDAAARRGGP